MQREMPLRALSPMAVGRISDGHVRNPEWLNARFAIREAPSWAGAITIRIYRDLSQTLNFEVVRQHPKQLYGGTARITLSCLLMSPVLS